MIRRTLKLQLRILDPDINSAHRIGNKIQPADMWRNFQGCAAGLDPAGEMRCDVLEIFFH